MSWKYSFCDESIVSFEELNKHAIQLHKVSKKLKSDICSWFKIYSYQTQAKFELEFDYQLQ